LHDLDHAAGEVILQYRSRGKRPVVLDEDRYELYRPPQHPRYFFRRLMWASLLSGGQATYGGTRTYEPYDGDQRGVQGYQDARRAGTLAGGADDFVHIHQFFADAGLTLVGLKPDDALVGGDPRRAKCIRDDRTVIVYLANPDGDRAETDNVADTVPAVTLELPTHRFRVKWFQPTSAAWHAAEPVPGGRQQLQAPANGDWILLLQADD
jgi:hypothetical protein